MDLAKPQVMDRATQSVQHAATQERGVAFVDALDGIMGSARATYDEVLASLPVPHRRVERWKYTPVASWWNEVKSAEPMTAAEAGCEPNPIPGFDAYRLVFVNGSFDAAASDLPVHPGVICMPLSQAPVESLQSIDQHQPEHNPQHTQYPH